MKKTNGLQGYVTEREDQKGHKLHSEITADTDVGELH